MTKITSLLVGMHFRPPAKQVLAVLPSGCQLLLSPEVDNPYDPNALKALVWAGEIPESVRDDLSQCLDGTGTTLEELLASEEPLWLGYVAASGGKPLAKAGLQQGNKEFLELMASAPEHQASLAFDPAGEPLVRLTDGES